MLKNTFEVDEAELLGGQQITLGNRTKPIEWFVRYYPNIIASVIVMRNTPKDLKRVLKVCLKTRHNYKELIQEAKDNKITEEIAQLDFETAKDIW